MDAPTTTAPSYKHSDIYASFNFDHSADVEQILGVCSSVVGCGRLRHYTTGRKVAGSIPVDYTAVLQSQYDMSTRNHAGGTRRSARDADKFETICELSV